MTTGDSATIERRDILPSPVEKSRPMPKSSSSTPPAPAFSDLGLDERLLAGLTELGYEQPTPIQMAAIPPLLSGRDVLAQAATGTGKTAAFALPLLHRLTPDAPARDRTTALILVPTRELAMQVAEAVHRYGKALGVSVLPVYGGASMGAQIRSLRRGVDVVIATPGRALDHIRRETLHLGALRVLVLDEADEMLDMGFAEDLEAILAETPEEKQTALFSATLPPRIATIARSHLKRPVKIDIERPVPRAGAIAKVRQVAYIVGRPHKLAALGRVLDVEHPVSAIVFCRTRTEVDELTETLIGRGFRAEPLHGGLSQDQRDRVMQKFRSRKIDLLVATDVAARGLDVQHVSHVVNYDVPVAAEHYVHRIGRTGRAGRAGTAITLAEPRERRMLQNIERETKQRIEIEPIPTVADLRASRVEKTRVALRETLTGGSLEAYRAIVDSLSEEFDPLDVAAAALKHAEPSVADLPQEEIPELLAVHDRYPERRPNRTGKPRIRAGDEMARLFIGAGRALRITPADIVAVIADRAGLRGREIGEIRVQDRHSTVEVPEAQAEEIIAALRSVSVRGKRVSVRRYQP
jgi:ATP-dependent RNA helicase DeaD